jgi:hypothetical protein
MAKKLPQKYDKLDKVIIIAGLTLLIITIIATVFGWSQTHLFQPDAIDLVYYSRYLVILGGGFLIGYLISRIRQPKASRSAISFIGIVYSLLAYSVFILLDMLRVLVVNPIGTLPFPWGKVVFEGLPILAIVIVIILALLLIRRTPGTSRPLHWAVVMTFVAQQLSFILLTVIPYGGGEAISSTTLWAVLLGIITTPLFVGVISYLFLGKIKNILTRTFYAALIGVLFEALSIVVWEFRTNAEAAASEIFGMAVFIGVLVFTAVVIWRAHRALR